MNESVLLKVALILGLAGIILLFFVQQHMKDETSSFLTAEGDEYVRLNGTVNGFRLAPKAAFFSIRTVLEVPVVVFDAVNISNGEFVNVFGKVDIYGGRKQIIAEEVSIASR